MKSIIPLCCSSASCSTPLTIPVSSTLLLFYTVQNTWGGPQLQRGVYQAHTSWIQCLPFCCFFLNKLHQPTSYLQLFSMRTVLSSIYLTVVPDLLWVATVTTEAIISCLKLVTVFLWSHWFTLYHLLCYQ